MLRNRILILLGGFFLLGSAAMADEVGYVDCSNHSEDTPVFSKPRKMPDSVGSIPCGERFTIIVYGFVFSRIQTKDGNVGFIYSSLIAVDHNATAAIQTGTVRSASIATKVPSARPASTTPANSQQIDASAPPTPSAATVSAAPPQVQTPAAAASNATDTLATAPAQASASVTAPASTVSGTHAPVEPPAAASATPTDPTPTTTPATPTATEPDVTPAQPLSVQPAAPPAPVTPAASSSEPTPAPAASQPNPPAAQPEAAPAPEPVTPPVRPAAPDRTPWEKPAPSVRTSPLIELYGGFAFNRLQGTGGAASTNFNGALGSFGWNFRPWLQLVADSSYNFQNSSGTKYVLYGNHYGPRVFFHLRNRWGLTPFVEGFVGGSRLDTTVSGASGYNSSVNGISYKAGGGLDIHPMHHIDIRLFDVDYYRTAFGTNSYQTNYWVSSGIVIRLFGGGSE